MKPIGSHHNLNGQPYIINENTYFNPGHNLNTNSALSPQEHRNNTIPSVPESINRKNFQSIDVKSGG